MESVLFGDVWGAGGAASAQGRGWPFAPSTATQRNKGEAFHPLSPRVLAQLVWQAAPDRGDVLKQRLGECLALMVQGLAAEAQSLAVDEQGEETEVDVEAFLFRVSLYTMLQAAFVHASAVAQAGGCGTGAHAAAVRPYKLFRLFPRWVKTGQLPGS